MIEIKSEANCKKNLELILVVKNPVGNVKVLDLFGRLDSGARIDRSTQVLTFFNL